MGRTAPALPLTPTRQVILPGQPGSNGYWRRQIWDRPGTFTWTATKDGKVKIQAIGAGSGSSNSQAGNPGHYGEKTLSVTAGQILTIVVGEGGLGTDENTISFPGGTTSISGTPVGGTPLVLPGAPGTRRNGPYGTQTNPSGPWDTTFNGLTGSAAGAGRGGPASASPFGPGVHNIQNGGQGGCGWGGPSNSSSGASSHQPGLRGNTASAPGRTARGGTQYERPESAPYWDLQDVDSGGGTTTLVNTADGVSSAGPGAGGAYNSGSAGTSALGGGSASNNNIGQIFSGNGAGAVGGSNVQGAVGNKGGNAYVQIFWDEVAA